MTTDHKPAVLMRRMTNPVVVGPQRLALDESAPMLRFPVEALRSRLSVVLPATLTENAVVQWLQNGTPIQGETRTSLVIENPTVTDSDVYWAEVSDGETRARSQSFLLMVHSGLPLQNQSVRGLVQPGKGLTAGFTIGRASGPLRPRQILIRGISPSLAKFGVTNVLSRVKVALFRRAANCNNLFSFDADLIALLTTKTGAFALADDVGEFTALAELGPGTYSVVLECDQIESGEALIEIYDTLA
jgi:hypothetical protein